jgi:antitoxin VapB
MQIGIILWNSTMGLNIKNSEVEQLAAEVAGLAKETKTEAIRKALLERRSRLRAAAGRPVVRKRLRSYMEKIVWPKMPKAELGRTLTREQEDQILGYGPEGF